MKKFSLLFITLMGTISVFGQNNWCGNDEQLENMFISNPELRHQLHENLIRTNSGTTPYADRGVNGTIPVVVHIIHDGGEGNIGYDQILDALDVLNEDYQKLNPDTVDTRNTAEAPFLPIAANIGLTFELAKLDPNGNCTNGVERKYAPGLTNSANDDCKLAANGGLDGWPYDKYLNIWVVNSIESSGAGITLAYASLPYFGADPTHGILTRHDAFGRIGSSNSDGETLTHEVGHILGLLHTFQAPFFGGGTSGCHATDCSNNGDYICDTPPTDVSTFGCLPTQNTCSDIPTGSYYGFDAYDQYENWMSYDNCQNMFTEGQKAVILTNLVDISFLANWITPSNNTATGVGLPAVLCQADFYADATTICAGDSIAFFDDSYFNVTGTDWTFGGGTPATSTASDPVVVYNTPGLYSVSLDVTDGTSTVSKTETDYILVLPNPGDAAPYFEGFQTMTALTDNNRFMVVNDNSAETWEHNPTVGIEWSKSAWIDNYGNTDGSIDELISGTIDLSGVDAADPIIFTFQYTYKKRTAANDDWLRFFVSNDCGETWVLRKNLHGNSLSTDVLTTPFIDPQDSDWNMVTVTNITSLYYTENFRFKFQFENDGGNNIYIDDINLYPESMTDVLANENSLGLSIYPNPVTDIVTIDLFANEGENYTIEIINSLGQKIESIYSGQLVGGLNQFNYSTATLPGGVYIVRVAGEGSVRSIKLIKE